MDKNTFSLLLKKEFIDKRKALLLGLAGIWATYILSGAFCGTLTMRGTVATGMEIFIFLFIGGLVLGIVASLAFSDMKTKEGRINTLMLPSTTFHKFLVRWVATVPMMLVVLSAAFLLGDWARMIVEKINGLNSISLVEWLKMNFSGNNEEWCFVSSLVSVSFLVSQAAYFLGSILWPKLSFIKTLAVIQILQIIAGILLATISFPRFLNIQFGSLYPIVAIIWIVGLLLTGLLYWGAYVRFKRSEVIYKLF